MITPSHMVYAWALSRSKLTKGFNSAKTTLAFILGALVPDIPVYLFFIVEGLLMQRPHEVMWDHMYFESWWSILFTLSHSMLIWPAIFLIAWYRRANIMRWFALSALIHVCTDFLVHTEDSYKHFWPLTDWRFISPISYWDRSSYGDIVGFVDSLIVLALLLWLLKNTTRWVRWVIIVVVVLYTVLAITGAGQVLERF